jgi:hypothetical protein
MAENEAEAAGISGNQPGIVPFWHADGRIRGPAVKLVGSRAAEDAQRIERRIVRLLPLDPPRQCLVDGFRLDIPDRPAIAFRGRRRSDRG